MAATRRKPVPAKGSGRAAIYARISLDKKKEGVGVERQIEACRKLAEAHEVEVVKVFKDNSKSAFKEVERTGYDNLVKFVEAGNVNRVYVYSTDRLTRRVDDMLKWLKVCKDQNVVTYAYTGEGINPRSANSKLVTIILGAIAEQESEHKAERIREAYAKRARDGKPKTGGNRMFGYELDGKTINKKEAAAIRKAATAIVRKRNPASLRSIVADWNSQGLKTTRGKDMDTPGLRAILKNPRIAGISTWTPTDPTTGKRGLVTREELGTGQWPAIIDKVKWQRLQAVLNDPSRVTNRVGNTPQHLLSGIMLCPCGKPMYYRTRPLKSGGRYGYYACKRELPGSHTHIGAKDADEAVSVLVEERLQQLDIAAAIAKVNAQAQSDGDGRLAELVQERSDLVQRGMDLEEAVAGGTTTVKAFGRAIGLVEKRIAEVEQEIATLSQRPDASPLAALAQASDIESYWRRADLQTRRGLVAYLLTVTALPGRQGAKKFNAERLDVRWEPHSDA